MSIEQEQLLNDRRLKLQKIWTSYYDDVQKKGDTYKQKLQLNLPGNSSEAVAAQIRRAADDLEASLNYFNAVTDPAERDRLVKEKVQRDYERLIGVFDQAVKRGTVRDKNLLNEELRKRLKLYRYLRANIKLDEDQKLFNETQKIINDPSVAVEDKDLALQLYNENVSTKPSLLQEPNILSSKDSMQIVRAIGKEFSDAIGRFIQITGLNIPEDMQDESGDIAEELIELEQNSSNGLLAADVKSVEQKVRRFNSVLLSKLKQSGSISSRTRSRARSQVVELEDEQPPAAAALGFEEEEEPTQSSSASSPPARNPIAMDEEELFRIIGEMEKLPLSYATSQSKRKKLLKNFVDVLPALKEDEQVDLLDDVRKSVERLKESENLSSRSKKREEINNQIDNLNNFMTRKEKDYYSNTKRNVAKAAPKKATSALKRAKDYEEDVGFIVNIPPSRTDTNMSTPSADYDVEDVFDIPINYGPSAAAAAASSGKVPFGISNSQDTNNAPIAMASSSSRKPVGKRSNKGKR